MSTPHPTTDRTATDQSPPTLTDGRWRATPREVTSTTTSPTSNAQRQFALDGETRLYNLIDAENRVALD